jgi:uncharacterized membrane protein
MTTTSTTADSTADTTASIPVTAPPAPIAGAGNGLAIASLVLGATSLVAGWTFIAPIVGLVLGFSARRREPAAQGFALAGIVLNAVALAGWVLAGLGVAAFGALALGSRLLHY